MRNICFIAPKAYQLFNPSVESTFGGAEMQLFLLAKAFAKDSSLDIHFIVADYGQKERETVHRITVWRSVNFQDRQWTQILAFFRVFRLVNADVYIQRTLTPYSGLIALYCRLRRKTFIYMVAHDSETDQTHTAYQGVVSGFLAKLAFRLARIVVTQNTFQHNQLHKRLGIDAVIIRSGYPIPSDPMPDKSFVLWVGRSMHWKRPEIFLKLAHVFPKEQFVIICARATNDRTVYDNVKRQAQALPNCRFIPFVPADEIDIYFQRAKIYVNTSTQEGFPNTFIQAAKNKTPILSLAVNPNNMFDTHVLGYTCNDDFELLKKHCVELLANPRTSAHMAENAYTYAKKFHDIEKNAKTFLRLIRERT